MADYPCPICKFYIFDSPDEIGEICPICFWEIEGGEYEREGSEEPIGCPNYELSIAQAQRNYLKYGAVQKRFVPLVRKPTESEKSPSNTNKQLAHLNSKMPLDIANAMDHTSHHRQEILDSKLCGCFSCLSVFEPSAISEWIVHDTCAVCPKCGTDSVLGDKSGLPISQDFLSSMNHYWFGDRIAKLN